MTLKASTSYATVTYTPPGGAAAAADGLQVDTLGLLTVPPNQWCKVEATGVNGVKRVFTLGNGVKKGLNPKRRHCRIRVALDGNRKAKRFSVFVSRKGQVTRRVMVLFT